MFACYKRLVNTLKAEKYITVTGLSLHLGHFSITVEELFIIENDRNGFVFWYSIILRFCQTAITWLRSLSAILPLFWRHGIAIFPAFAAKTWEMLLWRHEIHHVFPGNLANALQNLQFFHHFTMKFDIFSLNSTGESDFLILFLST